MNVLIQAPAFSAVAVLTLFAMLVLVFTRQLQRSPGTVAALGILGLVFAAAPALLAGSRETPAVLAVAALAALALLLLPSFELERDEQRVEVGALLLLGSAGAMVLATADNLLSLVLGLETLSLSVAVVTALGRGQRPLEAGFKYFVLAAVSVAALLYGVGLYVLSTGSLSLLAARPTDPTLQFVYAAALVLVGIGFAYELAVAPLHWGPLDVYTAAPPGLAGFIMGVSKLAAALALSKLALVVGAPVSAILVGVGVFSIIWGTFAALAQPSLRGMLGYSAIAHAGFLALALGSGPGGRVAAIFYVVTYAATAMLVFAAISGQGNDPLELDSLSQPEREPQRADANVLAGLGPLRGIALAIGLLSLAGIPPTPGFWAKLAILGPAWTGAGPLPTIIAVAAGVAGALYYLRPLPDVFATIRGGVRTPAGSLTAAAVTLAGAAVIIFGLVPGLAFLLASLSQLRA
jgi:NADH-quinone oxidoreductase subunit N